MLGLGAPDRRKPRTLEHQRGSRNSGAPAEFVINILRFDFDVMQFVASAAETFMQRVKKLNVFQKLCRGTWIVSRARNCLRKQINAGGRQTKLCDFRDSARLCLDLWARTTNRSAHPIPHNETVNLLHAFDNLSA